MPSERADFVCVVGVGFRAGGGVEIPELDGLVCGGGREEISMCAVCSEGEHGVDVVGIVGFLGLLALLFLLGGVGCGICSAGSKNGVREHTVDDVKVPDLDIWVHGTDGTEISSGVFIQRGGGGLVRTSLVYWDVKPFNT